MKREPMTHDFGPGRRCWGHDYAISRVHNKGQRLHASGWGCDGALIQEGDYLLMDKGGGRSTRYQVEEIERVMEPNDMWHATLVFAPRDATAKETGVAR